MGKVLQAPGTHACRHAPPATYVAAPYALIRQPHRGRRRVTGRQLQLARLLLLLLLSWITVPICATRGELGRGGHRSKMLLSEEPAAPADARTAADKRSSASDPPEWSNGIGDIKVYMFGDDDETGRQNLERFRKHCSSKTTMLTATWGRSWSWHDKINRLFIEEFRNMKNSQIVMLLDGDMNCYPCTRNLATEFLSFGAGVVVAGYPYNQEPTREKSRWFPPVPLLEEYKSPQDDHVRDSLRLFKYLNTGTVIGFAGALKYFLSQHYLAGGYVEHEKFDDQAGFWTNMYLAQEFSPWSHHYHSGVGHNKQQDAAHAVRHAERLVRIGVDAEGSIFQISLMDYKGRWMRTKQGLMQRELPYRKEACVLHFVGNKPKGLRLMNHTVFNATPKGGTVFGACPANATDTSIRWNDEGSCVCEPSAELVHER